MKKILPILIIIIIVVIAIVHWQSKQPKGEAETPGANPPVEDFGNALEKQDLIRLTTPKPNEVIQSPLTLEGVARGTWYFEASFPIALVDWDGRIIAEGHAEAQSDWMTTEFVPFKAVLNFSTPTYPTGLGRGALILKKDNPSGLPEHDDALEIPIRFE